MEINVDEDPYIQAILNERTPLHSKVARQIPEGVSAKKFFKSEKGRELRQKSKAAHYATRYGKRAKLEDLLS
jgi:hypothetical protein